MKKYLLKYYKYIILALLLYMPLFGHLDSFPIRIWDESRLAINAYEMHKNGDYIVTYFEGEPDMWNTKPPLMIWLQVLFMKITGVNELSLRLPSAFAALFTCLGLLFFSIKYFKNFWFGFIVILVLITSNGYIELHSTRSGEYNALLTLFTTLSGLSFFVFCENKKNKYLYLFFALYTLAILSKGITALLFAPALFTYCLLKKQLISILKNRHFYIGFFSLIAIVFGYYILREIKNPGFITAVIENELGGRYLNALDGHKGNFWFYIKNICSYKFSPWHLLIPLGIFVGFSVKETKLKNLTLFSILMCLIFLIVISTSQTKCHPYDIPLFPYLSILTSIFIFQIFNVLKEKNIFHKTLKDNIAPFTFLFPYIFLFLIIITPYQRIWNKTHVPKETPSAKAFYQGSYYLKEAIKGEHDVNGYYFIYSGYKAPVNFYLHILQDMGVDISHKYEDKIKIGDKIIVSQQKVINYLNKHYNYEKISSVKGTGKYLIKSLKDTEN